MTISLENHPFFMPWDDPVSGVRSYILDARIAPHQQTFYFTNPSISADGRYLWFYASFPPGPARTLAVVSLDANNPFIRHFPQDQFGDASPLVAPQGDACYITIGTSAYLQPLEGEPRLVCSLSDEYIHGRPVEHLATHLTLSADGRYLLMDGRVGNEWFTATGDIHTGEVKIIKEFGYCYNHQQFSPVDPTLFMMAQDFYRDYYSGLLHVYDQRIWLMRTDGSMFEPLRAHVWDEHTTHCSHEWWAADGSICWVDDHAGIKECTVEDRTEHLVWAQTCSHAHCDPTKRYYVCDDNPNYWRERDCLVRFYDRTTGKDAVICSGMPVPYGGKDHYHSHPHPQFCVDGQLIAYTTTVRGQVDVALTRTEGVLATM